MNSIYQLEQDLKTIVDIQIKNITNHITNATKNMIEAIKAQCD